ncbi:type II secretion system F family protein [Luteimicrobium subarcticum]|uniref:Type II secretion system (T2SS) protein F n=1 Tax=Luteimicrobium subarcticum TaxID=620910 RepID=A0A2M8WSG7_9MICO|nr:type II secretion system F family protein [Luteimicrobium subarcticum]PJI93873.1 type II secretion system (T2SS) protein F [Luteimicrobium subarcticum]
MTTAPGGAAVDAAVGVVVALLALAALAPWRPVAHRRARRLTDATTPGDAAACVGGTASCDTVVVLALLAAAGRTGVGLPRALEAVGAAVPGPDGVTLRRAADRLALGASWTDAWADAPGPGPTGLVVADVLAPSWDRGAAPGPALRAAAEHLRRERREHAATAAGRLGTRLVLPLGLCYLPAFVLVGIVPVLVAYGAGALG